MRGGVGPVVRATVVLVAMALGAPGAAAAQSSAVSFTVAPQSRFLDGARLDDPSQVVSAIADVDTVPVIVTATQAACGTSARWKRGGQAFTPSPSTSPGIPGCRFTLALPATAPTHLEVTAGGEQVSRDMTPTDKLVVALGDSVASGEGNPDKDGGWRSARCHRSAAAGVEQAARLLAQSGQGRSITFVNLACSGATVRTGLLGDYGGIESGKVAIPSQIDRLQAIVTRRGRRADAVLITVGANDVHFGDVVFHCIEVPSCPGSHFDPDHLGKDTTTDATVGAALGRLAGRYDDLATALEPLVAPAGVHITEYFDPTRDESGEPCGSIIGGRVTGSELRWAEDSVLTPLNQEVAAAATRHGWDAVGGIADAFATHGYCTAAGQSWIRHVGESIVDNNIDGPLHPNRRGHLAIADAIVPSLGVTLGIVAQPQARVEETGYRPPWWLVVLVVAGLVIVLVAFRRTARALRGWGGRVNLLLHRGHEPERQAFEKPELPAQDREAQPGFAPLVSLVVKVAGLLGSAVVSVGFVVAVGAAIVWVRFWAARYPADQAVDAVSREELLVIGAQAIVLYALLGALALVFMWLLDGKGTSGRRTRVALAVLLFVELVAALLLGGYGLRQFEQVVLGFAFVALLGLFLFEVVSRQAVRLHHVPPGDAAKYFVGRYFTPRRTDDRGAKESRWRYGLRVAWQAVPLLILAAATIVAARIDHASNRYVFVLLPILLAGALWVAPGPTLGGAATDAETPALRAIRAAIAAAVLVTLAIFLVRDEAWLAGAAVAAVALAGLCLTIAWASGDRFMPFAITVFGAVCIYGAVVACLRVIDAPLAQPVALLLNNQRAVCGVWVGESSGRVWYARLQLSERGAGRRPAPRGSGLTSVARTDVVDMALGPLQPVGRAQDQSVVLRNALQTEHGLAPSNTSIGCGPPRAPPDRPDSTPERTLAESVQPELIVDRQDGFWPVSVQTLFAMQDRRAHVCRRVADDVCIRVMNPSDLAFNGGEGEWLDYPPDGVHIDDEQRVFYDALGTDDPARTAREYFLVSRGPGLDAPYTVQFWFFYTFNYLRTGLWFIRHPAGFHEGDFETVAVMLSASGQPRYVWMARHKNEGRMFLWDEISKAGGHPVIYAARGSHADYEACRRQSRIDAPAGLIDDRPQCDPNQQLHLAPESTDIIDLSRVGWACWRGRFGAHPGGQVAERLPYESDDGPLGPLWQQRFGGVTSEPCRGVRDTGSHSSPPEEVLSDSVAARLQAGAGRLDPAVDSCTDWEHAPTSGAFLMACDRARLQHYVETGLDKLGTGGLHIDVIDRGATRAGPITIPAIRRDPRVPRLDLWRVTATQPTVADVYASCQAHKGLLEARFAAVSLQADHPLRVDDRARTTWRLRDAAGAVVGPPADVHVIKTPGDGAPLACGA
jgi:lysophospholipase L1-like esterase